MSTATRAAALRIVLIATGAVFTFGLYPLTQLWPSGWSWGTGPSHYRMMIVGVYGTLGFFLIAASRNPESNRSLILFTAVSSILHSAIMAVQAFMDPAERGHLLGDVPALLVVAVALVALLPSREAVVTDIRTRRAA